MDESLPSTSDPNVSDTDPSGVALGACLEQTGFPGRGGRKGMASSVDSSFLTKAASAPSNAVAENRTMDPAVISVRVLASTDPFSGGANCFFERSEGSCAGVLVDPRLALGGMGLGRGEKSAVGDGPSGAGSEGSADFGSLETRGGNDVGDVSGWRVAFGWSGLDRSGKLPSIPVERTVGRALAAAWPGMGGRLAGSVGMGERTNWEAVSAAEQPDLALWRVGRRKVESSGESHC